MTWRQRLLRQLVDRLMQLDRWRARRWLRERDD